MFKNILCCNIKNINANVDEPLLLLESVKTIYKPNTLVGINGILIKSDMIYIFVIYFYQVMTCSLNIKKKRNKNNSVIIL